MQHDLSKLGPDNFEALAQSLIKSVIGAGSITFGPGKDGAREATFSGTAPYPSPLEAWSGEWVFQAKFHDLGLLGTTQARAAVIADLQSELTRLTQKYQTKCDNYVLITNVPLTGVHEVGNRDRIARDVLPAFPSISNVHIWDANDVLAHLRNNRDLANNYAHLLTPGDVISELLRGAQQVKTDLATTLRMYLLESYNRDKYAALEQAGEVSDDKLLLERVFIDLNYDVPDLEKLPSNIPEEAKTFLHMESQQAMREDRKTLSLLRMLAEQCAPRCIILGGPGEGKSTIGQYLAQLHRSHLLRLQDDHGQALPLSPESARIPFRVVLKDFAQTLADDIESEAGASLDQYIAAHVQRLSGRDYTPENLHSTIASNPCIIFFDGLDEVTEHRVRARVLDAINSFLSRASTLDADLQVVATSRPNSYTNDFDAAEYLHLRLARLEEDNVRLYVQKWIAAKVFDEGKADRLATEIDACLADPQLRLLTATPLQVTILILIVLGGGTPPRQKEALFAEYLEIIYKREKAKSKQMLVTEKAILFGLHALLGYLIHREAAGAESVSATIPQERYEKVVRSYLRHCDNYSSDEQINSQVRQIAVDAGDRFVLIVEPAPDAKGFELRSIQEFFAAAHLSDTAESTTQRLDRLAMLASSQHWRNVCLFLAGRIGRTNQGEAPGVIEVCREVDRVDPANRYLQRGKWFALELAAERALGPKRALQDSLLVYGLGVLESPFHHDDGRLAALVERFPIEDVRDLVLPMIRDRASALKPEVVLDYIAAVIPRLPRNTAIAEVLGGALADAPDDAVTAFLRKHGHLVKAPDAAVALNRVWDQNQEAASKIIQDWFHRSWRWALQVLDSSDATPEMLRAALSGSGGPRSVRTSIILDSANPRHVRVAAALVARADARREPARSGVLGELLQFADTDDARWVDVANWIDGGDVHSYCAAIGAYADDESRADFWSTHLIYGNSSLGSLRTLANETPPVWARLMTVAATAHGGLTEPSPISAFCAFLLGHATVDEAELGRFQNWLSSRRAWSTTMAELDIALSDVEGLSVLVLKAFGPTALPDEVRASVFEAARSVMGLDPDFIFRTFTAMPVLWLEDGVDLHDALDRITTSIPQLAKDSSSNTGSLVLARLALIDPSRMPCSDESLWRLLDAFSVVAEHDKQSQHVLASLLLNWIAMGREERPAMERCITWFAAVEGEPSSAYVSMRRPFWREAIAYVVDVLQQSVEGEDRESLLGAARVFNSICASTPAAVLSSALTTEEVRSLRSQLAEWSSILEVSEARVLLDWLTIFEVVTSEDLLAGLMQVESAAQAGVWGVLLQFWQNREQATPIDDLGHLLEQALEHAFVSGRQDVTPTLAYYLAEVCKSYVPDAAQFEKELGLPFPHEDSGY